MKNTSHNSLTSNVSVGVPCESTVDRRAAIRHSWSEGEAAERQRLAIQMQIGLASQISIGPQKKPRFERRLEWAS